MFAIKGILLNTRFNTRCFSILRNGIIIKENVLPTVVIKELQQFTQTLSITRPSFVFSTLTKKDEYNTTVRKSQTHCMDTYDILEFVNSVILPEVSKKSDNLVMKLARDHVNFIKYEEGGFYDWHNDHEKYIINDRDRWLETQLILCIEAPTSGGDLQIKTDAEGTIRSIPYAVNQCVIFDKRMEHRAVEVLKGQKLIMTVDVLLSSREVQDNPVLDLLLVEAIKHPVGFRSYDYEKVKALYESDKDTWIMFGVNSVDTGTRGMNGYAVYDSVGTLYRYRGNEEKYWRYDYDDDSRASSVALDGSDRYLYEYRKREGEIRRKQEKTTSSMSALFMMGNNNWDQTYIQLMDYHDDDIPMKPMLSEPIPIGTDPSTLLDLPIIHDIEERKVGYIVACNVNVADCYQAVVQTSYGLLRKVKSM